MPKDVAFRWGEGEGCVDLKALCLISTCALTGLCFSVWDSLLVLELEERMVGIVKAYRACE